MFVCLFAQVESRRRSSGRTELLKKKRRFCYNTAIRNLLVRAITRVTLYQHVLIAKYIYDFADITQMPVLPYSLRAMYQHSKDKSIIEEFLPSLVRYFDWWRNTRDLGDGLVVAIHNW